jgi:putative transposase
LLVRGALRFEASTNVGNALPVAPDLLARDFDASKTVHIRAVEIAYKGSDDSGVKLAVVIDLFSSQMAGSSLTASVPSRSSGQ